MAITGSAVFTQWLLAPFCGAITTLATNYTGIGLSKDAVKVALFGDGATPDKNAAVGSTGFNTGTWTTTNEKTDVTNWVSGGRALDNTGSGKALTAGTGYVMYDAPDLAGGGNVTIASATGCFVYDDAITAGTVADQGICYNYFGGAQSVTGGTFTIVWNANGLFRLNT